MAFIPNGRHQQRGNESIPKFRRPVIAIISLALVAILLGAVSTKLISGLSFLVQQQHFGYDVAVHEQNNATNLFPLISTNTKQDSPYAIVDGDDSTLLFDKVPAHPSCADGFIHVPNSIPNRPNNSIVNGRASERVIPRIIHMIYKSRCVSLEQSKAIQSFLSCFPEHNFFLHDMISIRRYLNENDWTEFPQFQMLFECAANDAADDWMVILSRALILWKVGGIYVDIESISRPANGPSQSKLPFYNATILGAKDQAYFEVNPEDGMMGQHLFAAEPKHPLFFLWALQLWSHVYNLDDVGTQDSPSVVASRALMTSMSHFMQKQKKTFQNKRVINPWAMYEKVRPGHFFGLANRTLTVAPLQHKFVVALSASAPTKHKTNDSCIIHLYKQLGNKHISDKNSHYIPLDELVDTHPETSCPKGLVLIEDVREIKPKHKLATSKPRKIPRTIHMTSKSRCVTPKVAKVIRSWVGRFPDHKFYLHNDAALYRLLSKKWPEFPQLRIFLDCANKMVELADLWRALVIWEYGGTYTDIDTKPKKYRPSTLGNGPFDEAYFEVEHGGWLSQYFFAAVPKHPLMFLLVHQVWSRVYNAGDIGFQYAPLLTGPGALKMAVRHFMQTHSKAARKNDPFHVFEKVRQGSYSGLYNRTVTVAPQSTAVVRNALVESKARDYKAMNMTHFGSSPRTKTGVSCIDHLYLKTLTRL